MIKKNVTYSKTEETTVANFGQGTISMTVGSTQDNKRHVLFFKTQPAEKVGSTKEHGFKDSDELQPEIVFEFSNTESIDALISQLEEVKEQFQQE